MKNTLEDEKHYKYKTNMQLSMSLMLTKWTGKKMNRDEAKLAPTVDICQLWLQSLFKMSKLQKGSFRRFWWQRSVLSAKKKDLFCLCFPVEKRKIRVNRTRLFTVDMIWLVDESKKVLPCSEKNFVSFAHSFSARKVTENRHHLVLSFITN